MVSAGNECYHFFKLLTTLKKSTLLIFFFLVMIVQSVRSQHLPSTPVTEGYRDFNYGSNPNGSITETKPESKLWFNDGFWWGSLFDPVSENYRIHRFDVASQCWVNVGPDIDDRDKTLADALWDGTHLYVASHVQAKPGSGTSADNAGRLYRYSYDIVSNTYSLDPGFPVNLNNHTSESLVLTKDSTGQLWVTWTLSDRNVWVNRTFGDDRTWGDPFILPAMEKQIDQDDISGIIAFGGDKIGVMWSNQRERNMFFAVHFDSSVDTVWAPQEAAIEDSSNKPVGDDHINLSMACSGDGKTVVAVTKTSLGGSNPLIYFLKRSTNGQWSQTVFGLVEDLHTRPIVLVNSENDSVYVFAKGGLNPESIYMKSAHLDNPQFESGPGTLFIASDEDTRINDVTSTKQCINSTTGLLVIASDKSTRNYFHNYISLGPPIQRTLSKSVAPLGTGTIALNPNKPTYNSGESVVLTPMPSPDYEFLNWEGDIGSANPTDNPLTLAMNQDRNVTAHFRLQQFTLTTTGSPDTTGSVERSPDQSTYEIHQTVTLTALPAETFGFSGWSGDIGSADSTSNPLTIIMNQDRNITANFGIIPQVNLETRVSGSGNVARSPDKPTYNEGESVTLTATPNEGHDFVNWSGDIDAADPEQNPLTLQMDQNRIVRAHFEKLVDVGHVVYKQSKVGGSGTSTTVSTEENVIGVAGYTYLAAISIRPNVFRPNISVSSISGLGMNWILLAAQCSGGSNQTSVEVWTGLGTPTGSGLVTATFSDQPENAVIAVSSFSGVDSANPIGQTISGNTRGVHGACFGGPNTSSYAFELTPTVSGGVVYAAVAKRQHEHTPGTDYNQRMEVQSGLGQEAAGLAVQDRTVDDVLTLLVDGSFSAPLEWAVVGLELRATQHSLTTTIGAGLGGSIIRLPDKPSYNTGEPVSLIARADSGFQFVDWIGDIGGVTETDTMIIVEMTKDRSITANFVQHFALNVKTDLPGAGAIAISPDKPNYLSSETVALSVVANVGFTFLQWSGDIGDADSTDNPLSLEMTEARNITANFAAIARGLGGNAAFTKASSSIPDFFSLLPNYPNPFNIETNIEYTLPQAASVTLSIFNLQGKIIRKLVDGVEDAGFKEVRWNGKDSNGLEVSSGVYFVRLNAADKIFTMKILLQK